LEQDKWKMNEKMKKNEEEKEWMQKEWTMKNEKNEKWKNNEKEWIGFVKTRLENALWHAFEIRLFFWTNPTTVCYNASAVKIYNATSSLVRFKNNKIFSSTLKNTLVYYNAGVIVAKSDVVGLALGCFVYQDSGSHSINKDLFHLSESTFDKDVARNNYPNCRTYSI
jgi:hypothetical protein